jgi:hypothetical protein
MEIFLESFGPISGPKWTNLGSKIGIFGPICPKKWKISGTNNKKWMIIVLLGQLFKPIWKEIFFGIVWTYFRAEID